MGTRLHHATSSQRLEALVRQLESHEDASDWFADYADATSTGGYDNDGSTGPELVDNGIGLAFACRDYDSKATIFFAYGNRQDGNQTCYYVFGKDEEDALRRFREALTEDAATNGLTIPD